MCGIVGIIEKGTFESQINESILKSMSDVIIHRGPDSEGMWISTDHRCGLAFRRLSIVDLSSAGNQPMTSSNGRYTIVFNGEIYNHLDLRKDLENKGYVYHSGTDTETILNGFAEYGKDFLHKMVGMWGLAIWDDKKKTLFAARDRIGIKPFYYTYKNGRFIFGSEIKSILQHPSVSKSLNLNELPNYLNFGMSSNRATMFEGIQKLPAGHRLEINADGDLKIERYWSPSPNLPFTKLSENEIIDEIMRLLRQSIKDRMMSDVPFGVFLSGGIDSSVNVALMAELMDRPIDTYTVGFKELEAYNELQYARQISDQFQTNHHEVLIDSSDAFPILQELTWHEDEPNADPVCIPLWFLSKLTRQSGTTVIQVGEGSDEQFVGYKWMMRQYNFERTYWKYFNYLPQGARKLNYWLTKPIFRNMNILLAQDYIRRAALNQPLYWSGVSIFSPSHLEYMFKDKYQYLVDIPSAYGIELNHQLDNLKPDANFLQRISYVELTQRIAELLLMRVDKIGMAHSLEARVPFLDHRFVEFVSSIPEHIKVPDGKTTKYILKKAVESVLPKNIIYRKKQGFWAPVKEWLRNEWHGYARDKILDSYFVKEGIFDKSYLENMLQVHKRGERNLSVDIFSLLKLNLWHDKFFGEN
ncbi:MAG: asparagine synthase (glutamine-hydrolyzing) [Candidatus Kapabacteria bacterium]|nr:asparagine synthase (glutamine-hydrolyzing) [Candidatus Kapabacteria bacterium]